ncbi:MAG: SpoIIE family protein phosphatase [Clostridia bacterium]|nr:SpoIIE family protein phosphatase [Clostridia bacterium]
MKRVVNRPLPSAEAAVAAVPSTHAPAVTLLWCLLGLILPRAPLYGQIYPFGVSLAAAAHKPWAVMLAVSIGYLLGDAPSPMRYITAVVALGALRWVCAAVPSWDKLTFLPPLIAFIATLATGLALYSPLGLDGYRLVLLLAESCVCGGCTVFLRTAVIQSQRLWRRDDTGGVTAAQQASLILTGAVTIMASSTVTIGEFSPGRVLAAGLVLVFARAGQEQGGSMAGIILAAATALAAPGQTALALALALGGLLCGLFARFGRLMQTAVFLVGAGIVTLTDTSDAVLIHMYELFAAGMLFLLLPRRWDRHLHRLVLRTRELPAVEGLRRAVTMRLQVAASTLTDVSRTVGVVSDRLARYGAQDTAAVLRDTRSAVCAHCALYALCWTQREGDTLAAFEAAVPVLQEQGCVTADRFVGALADTCRQPERLAEHLTRRYEQCVLREAAWRRLDEIQRSVNDQFSGTAALLSSMAQDMNDPRQVDVELSGRVAAVCADHGMPVRQALCTRSRANRLTVDILAEDVGIRLEGGRWLRDVEAACGCTFDAPTTTPCGDDLRILLGEPPRYTVEIGLAQHCCDGEKLCGDAADTFTLDGRTVLVLSDGMGSGGRAAVDGAMTVGLTARLWKAGFSPDSVLHSVNAAMLVKSREESLATLDVAVIDTFSGRLDSYKAGAAATLLYSDARVSRVERASLPIGILSDVQFEHSTDGLHEGDILVMLSDGALVDGVAPLERVLCEHAAEDMPTLAACIADTARAAQTEHADDITVLTARICARHSE